TTNNSPLIDRPAVAEIGAPSRNSLNPALFPQPAKTRRYRWARPTPVHELCSDQNAHHLSVMSDVRLIRPTVPITVMRVFLQPLSGSRIMVVDIVAERLLQASPEIWL